MSTEAVDAIDGASEVRAFLTRFLGDRPLREDEDIFASGFVNSLLAIQLVLFVERTFRVTIENSDLDFDNFRTIGAIVRLVERKRARRTAV
jgi:methoxymalonate biosynthesis acyl carrier protein